MATTMVMPMRPMKLPHEPLFLCPFCRGPLPLGPPCACGFVLHESAGVIDLMTEEQSAEVQPFLEAYEKVRSDEQWGDDDLDLPFRPLRHHDIWDVRQRTFRAFEGLVENTQRGLALDIGAGNCWMTRYLDRWGFDAIALDINTSEVDGLRAGQKFIDEGARFLRVRAGMELLPFPAARIRLLATNASFHYATDFRAALSEFERVLTPGGMIVMLDTPFYESAADGERSIAERVAQFREKYEIPEALARRARYLTFKGFVDMMRSLNFKWRLEPVWPGMRRKYEEIRGAFARRRVAQFPMVVIQKREA
jgi:SAM-dependent methyltransferase